jgi:hypothetical protein
MGAPYAHEVLRAFTPEGGGVLTKLLAWLLVLAVLASAALFIFVRSQDPLALGDVKVATNDALRRASPAAGSDIAYRGEGEVFVATFIKNDGRLPVSLEGLVEAPDSRSPYVPVSLQLGTGTDTDPSEAAALTTFRIDPGSSVGVLVTYRANPDLVCQTIPTDPGAKGIELRSFSVRYSSYGIERTQELAADMPFATSAPPDRAECERATAA